MRTVIIYCCCWIESFSPKDTLLYYYQFKGESLSFTFSINQTNARTLTYQSYTHSQPTFVDEDITLEIDLDQSEIFSKN